jgi:UDP-2,3-diacylglucosamine pyrophosphatase LpxH
MITKNTKKRKIDILVLSDIHLGTYGCRSIELLQYLKSIKPKMVILNGDIVDMWQFSKRYWPTTHMKVVNHIFKWVGKNIKVYYITGNHDELLRKFTGFQMGSLTIENKLILDINGCKTWIFHGDVFDVTMQHSKWLTRLGSHGYDALIHLNTFANWVCVKMGREKISFSKKIKNSVKSAVKFINDFEKTTAEIAIEQGFDFVLCGHIHHPEMKTITTPKGQVQYLNSGDWIENLTSLEYCNGKWTIFQYNEKDFVEAENEDDEELELVEMNTSQLFKNMLSDFMITPKTTSIKFNS